ncbi:angiogenic factor with G patch and FHA domains 1 isoform X2 [Eurosta solidaginis]|uniref:angiogenic factor with G patch and FHA domains 1 isoform X2 n=1 Tax=Eurosta solidaginis TaxID=178769 RepID=UPI0035307A5E
MDECETENRSEDTKDCSSGFKLKEKTEIEKLEIEELCSYISELHDQLKDKDKEIHKYKEKYKQLLLQIEEDKTTAKNQMPDQATQTTMTAGEVPDGKENNITTVDNFVDDIRKAAEQAQNLNGFVYEPTSGLYYDQKTGYYYNAEYGLYYDGNNGCYYNYNQEKNQFEFHSQVQTTQIKKSAECHKTTNDREELTNYDDIADGIEEMVEFDEFGGVITDQEQLRKIKEERLKEEEEKRACRKKKKSKDVISRNKSTKKPKRRHKSKKGKRSCRKYAHSSNDSYSTCESESDKERKKWSMKRSRKKSAGDVEDGELTDCSSKISTSESDSTDSRRRGRSEEKEHAGCKRKKVATFSSCGRLQDIAKKYPPSLRIIVQESNLECLKVGSLSLITYKGGSLGREGNHDVIIPDVNVSKVHMKFHYDHKNSIYKCIDLGSRNGTVLNGSRMSAAKQESLEYDLVHGSVLQLGQTKLLCHIHEGNTTCGLCEPGLLIESTRESSAAHSGTVALTHREQLKKLQKKYGLENEKFVESKQTIDNYNDRAATRRVKIGSSTDVEKTQIACVNTEIPSENKGFKMLSKLGWNKGETLGKVPDGSGLLEPIKVSSNEGKKGLGCEASTPSNLALSQLDKRKISTWKKTLERYKQTDIFEDGGESA